MNLLFLDCETTGLSEFKNDIVQIACVAICDGVELGEFNQFGQPLNWDNIDPMAVATHGITEAMMRTFQPQLQLLDNFIAFAKSFGVKFSLAGHNVGFDRKMMSALFQRHGKSSDFFAIFDLNINDTLPKAKALKSKLGTENNKLVTLAKHFNIPIKAHDALSDIRATIELDKRLCELMGESTTTYAPIKTCQVVEVLPEPAQLHLHSSYSLIDAVPSPEEWGKWCTENNIKGYSVVDHGYGISLYNAVKNDNTKTVCIPGVGLNFKLSLEDKEYFHLNAWAISNEGYFNLTKLSSVGFENSIELNKITLPILTLDLIKANRKGLKFGSADIGGFIGRAVKDGNKELAEQRFNLLADTFSEDMFFELNPIDITHKFDKSIGFKKVESNAMVDNHNRQQALNKFIFEMAIKRKVHNLIPVSGACFINKEDKIIQDCLCKNGYDNGKYFQESYHAKTSKDLFSGLRSHLGDVLTIDLYKEMVQNTIKISEEARNIKISFKYSLPKIDIPSEISTQTQDYDQQLYLLTLKLIKEYGRWNNSPEYKERFKKEIDVIKNNKAMNFLPYFLVYEDLGRYARDTGFLQNIGRGSAGGSLLSYYLKIIHVDPIKNDLPFERFLSHARINAGSWPDIDMDISRDARPHLMKYMQSKYNSGFSQMATFSTMKTKNAIKDSMWALYGRNRNDFEIDSVCKTIPDSPQGTPECDFLYGFTDSEGEYHRGHLEDNEMLRNFFKIYTDVEKMVRRMIGVVRGISRHASAFVVSTVDLPSERCPTMLMFDKIMNCNIQVTQYDAKMCEKIGLVKADVLGLKTLSVVTDTLKLIKDVDYMQTDKAGMQLIYDLPEDSKVYNDFYNKKTDSSFQFNTSLVKNYLQQFNPTSVDDLSLMTSLCRPGALDAPIGFRAVVVVEYSDGSKQELPEQEYESWLKKYQNQQLIE